MPPMGIKWCFFNCVILRNLDIKYIFEKKKRMGFIKQFLPVGYFENSKLNTLFRTTLERGKCGVFNWDTMKKKIGIKYN